MLNGVTLTVDTGEVMFIIGQSGVGKSVLVKHLVGLLRPDAGSVLLDGVDVTNLTEREFFPIRKRCAMVFQNSTLFDSMSLVDNVALPIRKHKN
ncbi:MAG: ATP-binding cassette domain-containing protein, partial [Myxococcales bacterium]|nr:ATP-binding cassette domain-containing protein [Myxococcales bacterium]